MKSRTVIDAYGRSREVSAEITEAALARSLATRRRNILMAINGPIDAWAGTEIDEALHDSFRVLQGRDISPETDRQILGRLARYMV